MNCIFCPYGEIIRASDGRLYRVCALAKGSEFLRSCDLVGGCECDKEIMEAIKKDDRYHLQCVECAHFCDSGEERQEACENCINGDGDADHWEWDGDCW